MGIMAACAIAAVSLLMSFICEPASIALNVFINL